MNRNMEKAGKILSILVQRWTSKSPKLFVAFQYASAVIVISGTVVLAVPTAPVWLTTVATLSVAFFSGIGLTSKLTITDKSITDN